MEEDWDTELLEQEAAAAPQRRSEQQAWMVSRVQGGAAGSGALGWPRLGKRRPRGHLCAPWSSPSAAACGEGGAGLCSESRGHGADRGGNGCA